MKKPKRKMMVIKMIAGIALLCVLAGLMVTGWKIGWGPFSGLYSLSGEVNAITKKYHAEEHKNEIIFYGASNFRLWTDMESDLAEYKVQNHGIGGSTDKMLVQYAADILYPYSPAIVVLQTGSNDYVRLS